MKPTIVCVGSSVLDYVFKLDTLPRQAEKYRAKGLDVVGGGTAANAAVAIARLGGQAYLASRIGQDVAGRVLVQDLHKEEVNTRYIKRFENVNTSISSVYIDAQGERQIVSFPDPNMPKDPTWLPTRWPRGMMAVLGDTRWDAGSTHMFALARQAGKIAVLDGDRAPDNPRALELATHIAFSFQGLREVTGIDDPAEGLKVYGQASSSWVAVTMGERGVYYLEKGELKHMPAFKIKAVDTLGAGDVWHGAFTLALTQGQSEYDAMRFASAVAAIKCMRSGGRRGTPTKEEVTTFLAQNHPY
jgi:sulfofructose kinase